MVRVLVIQGLVAGLLFYYIKSIKKKFFGSQKDATNNQMELKAVIESLKILKKPSNIEFYTDSTYVKDGITKWIFHGKEKVGVIPVVRW